MASFDIQEKNELENIIYLDSYVLKKLGKKQLDKLEIVAEVILSKGTRLYRIIPNKECEEFYDYLKYISFKRDNVKEVIFCDGLKTIDSNHLRSPGYILESRLIINEHNQFENENYFKKTYLINGRFFLVT